jgi:hypothetical protein
VDVLDVFQSLADPLEGAIIRWDGGGPDGPSELLGASLVTASPRTALRVVRTLTAVLGGLGPDDGLSEFCSQVDEFAILFGSDGDGETAGLLLDFSSDLLNWTGRWQS